MPLGLLGMGLCLLYVRTGSLYPCVAAHALNNSIAFGVARHWGAGGTVALIVGSLLTITVVFALVRSDQRSRAAPAGRGPRLIQRHRPRAPPADVGFPP